MEARQREMIEAEKFDQTMRRANQRSSWAQLNQRDAQSSLNSAIEEIQENVRKGSALIDPQKVAPKNLRYSYEERKDTLSKQILLDLEASFLALEESDHGMMDKDAFVKTCMSIKNLPDKLNQRQMEHLFMKIDCNGTGSVSFEDFTSYILLQQLSREAEPASEHTTFVKVSSFGSKKFGRCEFEESEEEDSDGGEDRDTSEAKMTKPEMMAGGSKRGNIEKIARAGNIIEKILLLGPLDCYVTATQQGMMKLWSAENLKPLRIVQNGTGAWITDVVAMARQPLAVFALDRSITFYDTGRLSFDELGRVENLVNAPMCATWLRVAENDKLVYGDDLGIVHTFTFNDEWGGDTDKPFGVIDKRLPPGMTENIPWLLHSDWVTRVRFLSHSNSLMTTSMDGSLLMLDFERRHLKWSAKEHAHGIYGCEYCRSYNFIVTCGLERYINIWNPFTAKTMGVLHGHEASVLDVVVNEADNQIVSIGADSVIKVWDMRSTRCLQTVYEKTVFLPTRHNLYYDNEKNVLLCGGVSIEMWHKRKAREARTSKICSCLYNSLFRQVVVGEVDSLVMVWNIENGDDVFTFSDDSRGTKLSAMAFDQSQRRLLLGGQDGSLRMWNFNNGQCLKEFHGFGMDEINAVMCLVETKNMYAIAAGWNKKVCLWHDGSQAIEPLTKRMVGHTDDVVCMTNVPPSNIATGGCDGKIIIWKLDGVIKTIFRSPEVDLLAFDESTILNILYLSKKVKMLVASIANGHLHFWRLHDSQRIYDLETQHYGAPGPICVDAKNDVIYTCCSRGYVKIWYLNNIDFSHTATIPFVIPAPSTFRAHHESIVSLAFVDQDRLLITTSLYGTIRLWTQVGIRIGQFGQNELWDLSSRSTWRTREPSYLSPALHRKGLDPALMRQPVRPTGSRGSRGTSIREATPMGRTSTTWHDSFIKEQNEKFSDPLAPAVEVDPRIEYEARKKAVLDYGPPWLRMESWYNPFRQAIDRQLPYKNLNVVGPLRPPGSTQRTKRAPRQSITPSTVRTQPTKQRRGSKQLQLQGSQPKPGVIMTAKEKAETIPLD
ncbi:unnamed protein product [Calypogeia fissa]